MSDDYNLRLPTDKDKIWYKKNRGMDIDFMAQFKAPGEPPALIVESGKFSTVWACPDEDLIMGDIHLRSDENKWKLFG